MSESFNPTYWHYLGEIEKPLGVVTIGQASRVVDQPYVVSALCAS